MSRQRMHRSPKLTRQECLAHLETLRGSIGSHPELELYVSDFRKHLVELGTRYPALRDPQNFRFWLPEPMGNVEKELDLAPLKAIALRLIQEGRLKIGRCVTNCARMLEAAKEMSVDLQLWAGYILYPRFGSYAHAWLTFEDALIDVTMHRRLRQLYEEEIRQLHEPPTGLERQREIIAGIVKRIMASPQTDVEERCWGTPAYDCLAYAGEPATVEEAYRFNSEFTEREKLPPLTRLQQMIRESKG